MQQYDNIPAVLKKKPNWVAYGIRGAPLKSPYNPESLLSGIPLPAKAGFKGTWGVYENAVECVRQELAQGIGYEFDGGVYGVDLDHVLDGQGRLSPQALEIVGKLNSYTEISPSGTGLHIYVLAPGAKIMRHRKKDCFLEIYSKARYFTVTGNIYGRQKGIRTRTAELQEIHDRFLLPDPYAAQTAAPPPPLASGVQSAEQESYLQTGLERDRVMAALWAGERRNGNESSDDMALMNKLAYYCNAAADAMIQAFLQSPHYMQKDEFHKQKCRRPDYLPNTAKNACAAVYSTAAADYERRHKTKKYER